MSKTWAEQKVYKDIEGREITEFVMKYGKSKGKSLFKGKVQLKVRVRMSNDPKKEPEIVDHTLEFDFPDNWTINQCENNFDEEATKAVAGWQEAQKKAQDEALSKKKAAASAIIPASSIPRPILGANGRPLGS